MVISALRKATLTGCIAVVIWSFSIVLLLQLNQLPVTELVGVLYLLASIPSLLKLTLSKRWHTVHVNKKRWGIGVTLLSAFQLFVAIGVRYFNPAAAELIIQLWPILTILLLGFLPKETFNLKYIIPVVIASFGFWTLFLGSNTVGSFTWSAIFPMLACGSWCGYVLFSRFHKKDPPEMVGLYLGGGGVIILLYHFIVVGPFSMNVYQLGIISILGVGVLGVAQLMWDYGIKYGDVKVMSIFANINPALALTWLIAFGYAKSSLNLFISYGLIIFASLFAYVLSVRQKNRLNNSIHS